MLNSTLVWKIGLQCKLRYHIYISWELHTVSKTERIQNSSNNKEIIVRRDMQARQSFALSKFRT